MTRPTFSPPRPASAAPGGKDHAPGQAAPGAHHALARWARRGDIGLRVVAGVPLGYAVASLWAMALARILPMARAEATVAATLVAFPIAGAAMMWAFAARSGWRAAWTLALAGGIAGAIAWASIATGGRA